MENTLDIAIDFDGTIVKHEFPKVGEPIPECIDYLKQLNKLGARLILNTMRSGKGLEEAVNYLKENDVELFGINVNPDQTAWTCSPKVYGHIYVDDAALGAPLITPEVGKPYIDWSIAGPRLVKMAEDVKG